jgi:hypothetical protein
MKIKRSLVQKFLKGIREIWLCAIIIPKIWMGLEEELDQRGLRNSLRITATQRHELEKTLGLSTKALCHQWYDDD